MEQKILEGNKLIAIFTGWREECDGYWKHPINNVFILPIDFTYHISWDSLMPVIKKILDITFEDEKFIQEDYNIIIDNIPNIEETWKSVISFIKEYNYEK